MPSSTPIDPRQRRGRAAAILGTTALLASTVLIAPGIALGQEMQCSKTSIAARRSGYNEAREEKYATLGSCHNLVDLDEREECQDEAKDDERDSRREVRQQYRARQEVCGLLGEAAFDPVIDPADFVDPLTIGGAVAANPYFPLVPGNRWVYENEEETITVEVAEDTRTILGVTTIVVRDTVVLTATDELVEDTDDWYAQDALGNVWYFGEIARNYEDGVLTDLDGSWTAGVDYAKPGILMHAAPMVGDAYRQEFLLTEAEDVAEILSITEDEESVLEGTTCSGAAPCLITKDYTPIEPGVVEHKVYAPGVGFIVEFDPEEPEERTELVEFVPG